MHTVFLVEPNLSFLDGWKLVAVGCGILSKGTHTSQAARMRLNATATMPDLLDASTAASAPANYDVDTAARRIAMMQGHIRSTVSAIDSGNTQVVQGTEGCQSSTDEQRRKDNRV